MRQFSSAPPFKLFSQHPSSSSHNVYSDSMHSFFQLFLARPTKIVIYANIIYAMYGIQIKWRGLFNGICTYTHIAHPYSENWDYIVCSWWCCLRNSGCSFANPINFASSECNISTVFHHHYLYFFFLVYFFLPHIIVLYNCRTCIGEVCVCVCVWRAPRLDFLFVFPHKVCLCNAHMRKLKCVYLMVLSTIR